MNILVLSWRDPEHPLSGGAEQVVHEHCKGWIKAGHSVSLFSSDFKGAKKEILDGVQIIRYGNQLLGVQIAAFFWYLFSKHQKFDLVIDQFHGIPFFTPFFVRAKKLAIIQEVAKEVWLLNHLPKPLNWIIGWLGYLMEPYMFLIYRSMTFMTGSRSTKNDLIKFGILRKNITVIPHGVIVLKPKKISKEKIKTIVFLGALAKDKGIEDAIKSFSILDEKGKFKFWILGKGSDNYLIYLNNLVRKSKFRNRVDFFGFVSQEKKFELLSKAHILINPSVREGWGLVNIEANSMGTPVVAYLSPGLIDSVKEGLSGIMCQKNSPENMAENVIKLLADDVLYSKLQKGSLTWSKNFSWEMSRELSLNLIEKIVYE